MNLYINMDLQAIILNNAKNVFFFSKDGCPNCDKLAGMLDDVSVPYNVIKLEEQSDRLALVNLTKHNTFPQLFFGPTFIGGLAEFQKLCFTLKLEEKLKPLGIVPEIDF